MSRPKNYVNHHVQPAQQGKALAAVLREFMPDKSWNQVKKLITARQIQVNGNLCLEEARKVKSGDVIQVWQHPLAPPADERSVKIRFADQHLVIIEKPAGITTLRHAEERNWSADRKRRQPTLDELVPRALARHLGWNLDEQPRPKTPQRGRREHRHQQRSGPQLPPIRAVHRLDRDTSGLMVFARTQQAETALIRLFSKHRIERAYLAVVYGRPEAGKIETMLVRDRGDGLRGSVIERAREDSAVADVPLSPEYRGEGEDQEQEAQQAITHIKPLEVIGDYSLIECKLETGRTHQIRIHLSERGHMLCGEKTYTHPLGEKPQHDTSGAPRQALHAAVLGFIHPSTGETLSFKSTLPADLQQWLQRLKQQPRP
ncbi:RluA family pseudouridine synthase [Anatilimnocola floriformis]|uniref:RluA family pseudouridine synthase n=1 Tax=Anatilimnocola floriformis TaxID=2948575 RepID=UPI0020C1FF66|nr:pseudouridine synthase [Anatilimnocola floriformis]